MVWLLVGLGVLAAAALWGLRRTTHLPTGPRGDSVWLPDELRGADLVWSEKSFRFLGAISVAVRIDRAYRGRDDRLTLVEFKRRQAPRTYLSDVVELSVQGYVLKKAGLEINERAYVAVVLPDGGPAHALPVGLENAQSVERRAA